MAEVRKNAGTGRLSSETICSICCKQFIPGEEYAMDRSGPSFFYSHVGCRDAAVTVDKPKKKKPREVKVPAPDVEQVSNGIAVICYRGFRYNAMAFTEHEGTGPVLWGLFHRLYTGGEKPMAVERNPEVGLGGLVSWLMHNR